MRFRHQAEKYAPALNNVGINASSRQFTRKRATGLLMEGVDQILSGDHELLQLRVLALGLLQDGKVRIGIFPKREEFLIRSLGLADVA